MPVVIEANGGGWVARTENARYGDIEVRLAMNGSDATVAGGVRGTAIDLFSIVSFPNPSRVAVSGDASGSDATLTGSFLGPLAAATGTLSGTLVFTDNQGGVMTCSAGTWFLYSSRR